VQAAPGPAAPPVRPRTRLRLSGFRAHDARTKPPAWAHDANMKPWVPAEAAAAALCLLDRAHLPLARRQPPHRPRRRARTVRGRVGVHVAHLARPPRLCARAAGGGRARPGRDPPCRRVDRRFDERFDRRFDRWAPRSRFSLRRRRSPTYRSTTARSCARPPRYPASARTRCPSGSARPHPCTPTATSPATAPRSKAGTRSGSRRSPGGCGTARGWATCSRPWAASVETRCVRSAAPPLSQRDDPPQGDGGGSWIHSFRCHAAVRVGAAVTGRGGRA